MQTDTTITKAVRYNRDAGEFDVYVDGDYLTSFATLGEAEAHADAVVYRMLTQRADAEQAAETPDAACGCNDPRACTAGCDAAATMPRLVAAPATVWYATDADTLTTAYDEASWEAYEDAHADEWYEDLLRDQERARMLAHRFRELATAHQEAKTMQTHIAEQRARLTANGLNNVHILTDTQARRLDALNVQPEELLLLREVIHRHLALRTARYNPADYPDDDE